MTPIVTFSLKRPTISALPIFALICCHRLLNRRSASSSATTSLHMFALALAVTLTIYATLEIEYPRQGLIRLTDIDKTLIKLRDSMN
jgi:hypothetical protein